MRNALSWDIMQHIVVNYHHLLRNNPKEGCTGWWYIRQIYLHWFKIQSGLTNNKISLVAGMVKVYYCSMINYTSLLYLRELTLNSQWIICTPHNVNVELVSVDTIIVSLWNTMRNYTSHNVDITCAVAPWIYVPMGHIEIALCQWDTKETMKYASVRRTRLHMMVAVLCLTLNPGQAKLLTKRQRKRVTWF